MGRHPLIVAPCSAAHAAEILGYLESWETDNDLDSIDSMLQGAVCFEISNEGQAVGVYALKQADLPGGVVVWITAMRGNLPGCDLVATVAPIIEKQIKGTAVLAVQTRRPGMVRKLLKAGYEIGGTILVKKINE